MGNMKMKMIKHAIVKPLMKSITEAYQMGREHEIANCFDEKKFKKEYTDVILVQLEQALNLKL